MRTPARLLGCSVVERAALVAGFNFSARPRDTHYNQAPRQQIDT